MFPARCLIVFSIKHRAGVDVYCLVLHAARDSLVNIFVPLKVKYKQISHSAEPFQSVTFFIPPSFSI